MSMKRQQLSGIDFIKTIKYMQQEKHDFLHDLLETIKEQGLEFATVLLGKLAGHVSEETLKASSTDPCPQGYIKNSKGECVPDVG